MNRKTLVSLIFAAISIASPFQPESIALNNDSNKSVDNRSDKSTGSSRNDRSKSSPTKNNNPTNNLKKLYVNTNPKHYSIKKSQLEGEKDLIELAKTSEIEEAWAFDTKKGIWYECGINEKRYSAGMNICGIKTYLLDCVIYHIHLSDEKNENLKFKIDEKVSTVSKIAFPTIPTDVSYWHSLKKVVASEYGIIEFSNLIPNEITREKTNKKWDESFKKINENYYKVINDALKEKFTAESSSEEAIKYAVEKANKEFKGKIKLEYRPAKN